MANIPIDPLSFVPTSFQIQHVEGRMAVHGVVMPKHPCRHEDFAIATIHLMPPGRVHFANVRGVLHDFWLLWQE
jgi:hypothetical protein